MNQSIANDNVAQCADFAEHQLRKEFKADAMKKCDLQINAFASCAKEEGVFVIFRCREFRKFGVRITTKNTMFSILKESNLLDRYGMKTIRRTSGERMHGRLQLRRKI